MGIWGSSGIECEWMDGGLLPCGLGMQALVLAGAEQGLERRGSAPGVEAHNSTMEKHSGSHGDCWVGDHGVEEGEGVGFGYDEEMQ